jgi:hypothetical protein
MFQTHVACWCHRLNSSTVPVISHFLRQCRPISSCPLIGHPPEPARLTKTHPVCVYSCWQKLCVEFLFEIVSCLPPRDTRVCVDERASKRLLEGSPLLRYMISLLHANSSPHHLHPVNSPVAVRACTNSCATWCGPGDEVAHICDGYLIEIYKSRTLGYTTTTAADLHAAFLVLLAVPGRRVRGLTLTFRRAACCLRSMEHDMTMVVVSQVKSCLTFTALR